jgi:hypothetical protein
MVLIDVCFPFESLLFCKPSNPSRLKDKQLLFIDMRQQTLEAKIRHWARAGVFCALRASSWIELQPDFKKQQRE